LAYLPAVLDAYAKVDTAFIGSTLAGDASGTNNGLLPPDPTFSDGVFFSTLCNEQAPFVNRNRLNAQINGNEPIRRSVAKNVLTNLNICKQWPSGRGTANENKAVPLTVPTIVFNGEFDLQTPANVGRGVAARSPFAKSFDFPAIGHIALQQSPACAISILADFQRNQDANAVDASCLPELPEANWKTAIDEGFFELISGS
jgi:pimeloyl-ACP methyl ester carboxylesterase